MTGTSHRVPNSLVAPGEDVAMNDGAWEDWRARVEFHKAGYHEVWERATDGAGQMQSVKIDWNPKVYLNNTMHRVAVRVG